MDYCVGSVAALISGNVTPNRPKLLKRALTPVKHQSSPNVTPKSEFVDDRSIFMSPSLQKKKAIVKKSPKRIFENPDLDVTNDGEDISPLLSPQAEKVKKHLKDDLDASTASVSPKSAKSPKKNKNKPNTSTEEILSKKKNKAVEDQVVSNVADIQAVNERTPKKKKKQKNSFPIEDEKENINSPKSEVNTSAKKKRTVSTEDSSKTDSIKKSQKKKLKLNPGTEGETAAESTIESNESNKSTKNKRKMKTESESKPDDTEESKAIHNKQESKKNKKKRNKKAKLQTSEDPKTDDAETKETKKEKKLKTKSTVNPNAITNEDTDSEHESDDEINSDTDQINKEVFNTAPAESSDEEEEEDKSGKPEKKQQTYQECQDDVKRTIFVGNVPYSKKCKKELKKIFKPYGDIESVRIRNVPVKDARTTPKLAAIKNELHPERTTVNVYIKYVDPESVKDALKENNTVLNDYHLRVTRSDTTGSEHDPHKAIFIGNLPFALEDDALRAKFANCGEIDSIRIVRDKKTNAGKGFGYVNFASKDGVELALALTEEDLTIKNRILRVKRCSMINQKAKVKPEGNGPRNDRPNFRNGPRNGVQNFRKPGGQNFNRNGPRNDGQNFRNGPRNDGQNFRNGPRNDGQNFRNGPRNEAQNFRNGPRNDGQNFRNGPRNDGQNFRNGPRNESQNFGGKNVEDGAHRRILKKRQNEDGSGGPPAKQERLNQPAREKKQRKEFVGMTSEKKKKRKVSQGMKQRKAISEILSK